MSSLDRKAGLNFATRALVLSALLFIPAGSLAFPRGWVFLALYFLPQVFMGAYFLRTNPKFVERRLKLGPRAETRARQKLVMVMVILMSFISVVIAGLDHRFGWSHIPFAVSIAACGVMLIGLGIQFRVFVENSFASATIEIADDQRIIATGPYAVIRHPMYFGSLLTDCCIPVVLGSCWAFIPMAIKVPVVVIRLLDEEEFLRVKLAGYAEYCQKVRHRLLPLTW